MRRALVAATALLAQAAAACPVCGLGATDQSQGAYIDMSIVISLVPLVSIGAIVTWVALRMRAARREEAREARARLTRYAPGASPR